jgi:hypothetical protein
LGLEFGNQLFRGGLRRVFSGFVFELGELKSEFLELVLLESKLALVVACLCLQMELLVFELVELGVRGQQDFFKFSH